MTHKLVVHAAKEFAGTFYDADRSDMFRATWPNQMEYVNTKWPHFVEHVRTAFTEMLGRSDVAQRLKDEIYDALVADAPTAHNGGHSPLPIAPGTEAFVGDRRENMRIDEAVGKRPMSLAEKLRTTTAFYRA